MQPMQDTSGSQKPPINQQGYIVTPEPNGDPVTSLNSFLTVSGKWHDKNNRPNRGMLSDLWYRGVARGYPNQAPGVYKRTFSERAKGLAVGGGLREQTAAP